LPFTLKSIFKAKNKKNKNKIIKKILWKLKYFTMQKYNLQKIL